MSVPFGDDPRKSALVTPSPSFPSLATWSSRERLACSGRPVSLSIRLGFLISSELIGDVTAYIHGEQYCCAEYSARVLSYSGRQSFILNMIQDISFV